MRAFEFIKEVDINSPQRLGGQQKQVQPAQPGDVSQQTGTQPKNLTLKGPTGTTGTTGTTGSSKAPQPQQSDQQPPNTGQPMGQDPTTQHPDNQQNPQQPDQSQMQNDAMMMARRLGLNPQQSQEFTSKIMGPQTTADQPGDRTVTPQDMQKAMPKPGSNVNVKNLGPAQVLPTPADEKGIKLDTTKRLGYPVVVDPRDLQR